MPYQETFTPKADTPTTVRVPDRRARMLAAFFATTTVLLAAALGWTWVYIGKLKPDQPPPPPPPSVTVAPVSRLLLQYRLQLPGGGEIFPAMASDSAAEHWPVAVLTVSNTSDQPIVQTVTAEIPGWSTRQEVNIIIGGNHAEQVKLYPELLPIALENTEVRPATLKVTVSSSEVGNTYTQTRRVLIHSGSDIYWGKRFSNAQYVARWVTPHDPAILTLISQARKWMPAGRMPGYNGRASAPQVQAQATAVFNALKNSGISYVSSIYTFGNYVEEAQRIRLPSETLRLQNANCMDVSVAFASAMENLGMEPVITIVPGHAFAGVRLGRDSSRTLHLDLTVLPKGSFRAALARAQHWLAKTPPSERITVDVAAARTLGIYPM